MPLLLARALPLPSGGGGVEELAGEVEQSLEAGFGLAEWIKRLNRKTGGRGDAYAAATRDRLHRVLGGGGGGGSRNGSVATGSPKGTLNLGALFSKAEGAAAPPKGGYRVELGCGVGEWLATQATASPDVR